MAHVTNASLVLAWNNTAEEVGDFVPVFSCDGVFHKTHAPEAVEESRLSSTGPQSVNITWPMPYRPQYVQWDYIFGPCWPHVGAALRTSTTGLQLRLDVSFDLEPAVQVPYRDSYRPLPLD